MASEEKDLSGYESEEDLIESDFGSTDRVRRLFDVQHFDLKTTTDKKISLLTLGDAVSSVALQQSKVLLHVLSTLEEHFLECKSEDKANGLSAGTLENLYDFQQKIASKYNDCVKILNSMKTKTSL